MDNTSLTPSDLVEHPELAALRILKTNLDVAGLALLATYPDNGECSERPRSEQEAYAFAILHQIDALEAMLEEYAESIHRLGRRPGGDAL
jgi:hypothetical protein